MTRMRQSQKNIKGILLTVVFLAIIQLATQYSPPVTSCSTLPCVSTDIRTYARCLNNQCGSVCPSSLCGATNCNYCQYNRNGPCCSSCCQNQYIPQPRPQPQPQPCQPIPSWPYYSCPYYRQPCQGIGCGSYAPWYRPSPCQGIGCLGGGARGAMGGVGTVGGVGGGGWSTYNNWNGWSGMPSQNVIQYPQVSSCAQGGSCG